ncbi:MAG: secondary thiamine-phosphate synthase enzyme YjbQ [Candidatus Nanoarchaeia archaeon]
MELNIKTSKREEIIDITSQVKEAIQQAGDSKACLIYTPHATAAIIVNENYDKAVCDDILNFLKKHIPQGKWKHDKIDGNADAHIKSSIIGPSQIIPINNGRLQLGTWQGIALAEFDGPRSRRIIIQLL